MTDGARRVLAVSAHPDDAEFTSGGSLARWIGEGWAVYLVVCTDGGKGSYDASMPSETLTALRYQEQQDAARVLGIESVLFLGHPDGELAATPSLAQELAQAIRLTRPDRLLCWDPWRRYQLHPDHRAAGLAALDAVLAAGNPHFFPEQLASVSIHRVEEVYLFGSDEPDEWVDITQIFDRKMAAIERHRSQVAGLRDVALRMSHCNQGYGEGHDYIYAEAFKVLHPFCDT